MGPDCRAGRLGKVRLRLSRGFRMIGVSPFPRADTAMNRLRTLTLLALAAVVSLAATVARGQSAPLADKMPADPILYVGWAGAERVEQLYGGTHAQAVLAASNFDDVFNRFLPGLLDALARQDPETRDAVSGVKSLGPILWKHPTALVFGGVDYNAPGGEPMPRLVMTCDAGPDAARLRAKLIDVFGLAGNPGLATLVREKDGVVSVVLGYDDLALADAATDVSKSLAGSAAFKTTFAGLSEKPVFAVYADAPRTIGFIKDVTREQDGEQRAAEVERNVLALGFGGLGRLGVTGGFVGKNYETRGFLGLTARDGVLRLLPDGPLDAKTLAAVPADATQVAAGQLDLHELLNVVRDLTLAFDPQAAGQMQQALGIANALAGTDVENDLLARFGKTWAGYVSPGVGSGIFSGVVVNRPDDPAKLANAFARASTNALILANQKIRSQSEGNITLPGRMLETPAGKMYVLNLPVVAPSWAVDADAGLLRFGFFPQSIISAKSAESADAKPFAESGKWSAARRALGVKEEPAALQYADLPALAEQSYPLILMGSQTAFGAADLFAEKLGIRPPLMVLPPLSALRKELEPSAAVAWSAGDGLHFKGTEPFPLSGLLTTDPQSLILNYASTSISVLLPSLNRARAAANKVKSASNLRQIGQAMRQAAIDDTRSGRFPADLETLYLNSDLTPQLFVSPRSSTPPPPGGARTREGQAEWVAANSDYVYVAGGLTDAVSALVPVAYEDPAKLDDRDGVNVLYGDGSVRFIPLPALRQELQQNVDYRRKKGIDVPDALKTR